MVLLPWTLNRWLFFFFQSFGKCHPVRNSSYVWLYDMQSCNCVIRVKKGLFCWSSVFISILNNLRNSYANAHKIRNRISFSISLPKSLLNRNWSNFYPLWKVWVGFPEPYVGFKLLMLLFYTLSYQICLGSMHTLHQIFPEPSLNWLLFKSNDPTIHFAAFSYFFEIWRHDTCCYRLQKKKIKKQYFFYYFKCLFRYVLLFFVCLFVWRSSLKILISTIVWRLILWNLENTFLQNVRLSAD